MNSTNRGLPYIFYPVLFLSGIASSIAISTWFRMYTNLFGIHQFSVTSIVVSFLICLAAGSRIGGRLADKTPELLILFVILQGITGIYTLFHPFLFELPLRIFGFIIHDFHPASFGVGIVRIILTVVSLFLPLASISAVVPVLSRYFTKHIIQSGNRLSHVLSVIFAGMAAGLLIYGFYLVRHAGLNYSMLFSAIAGLGASGLSMVYFFQSKTGLHVSGPTRMAMRVRRTAMLFRKRRPVLETGVKLSRAMIRVHAIQGFASASLLIIAYRLTSEYAVIGLPFVHLLILSVFFTGLAIGGSLYKKITEGTVNGYLLMASLEILSGFIILFSFLLFTITAPGMLELARHTEMWLRSVVCQAIAISSLLLLPSLITGLLVPLAARMYPRRIQQSGRNIGKLGSLFYMGALFGVVITHYLLLPLISSFYLVFLLMGVALLSGIYLLLMDSRLIRGFRLSFTAVSVACITGILFGAVRMGWINPGAGIHAKQITEKQEGSSALVALYDLKNERQAVYIDGIENQVMGREQVQQLPAILSYVMGQSVQSSLVTGFGTGIVASTLEDCDIPSIYITDLYPEVLTLSANAFSEQNHDILTSSRVDIAIEDARLFLMRNSRNFDLITSGYTSIKNVPSFFTSGFYRVCLAGLSSHGLLTQELPLRGIDKQEFRSLIRACIDVFPEVSLWNISSGKVLLVARKHRGNPGYCTIAERFGRIDQFGKYSKSGIAGTEALLGRRLMDDKQLRIFAGGAPPNTDDHPYVEFSKTPAAFVDPELIKQLIREMNDTGNPYFKEDNCLIDNQEIREKIDSAKQASQHELSASMKGNEKY